MIWQGTVLEEHEYAAAARFLEEVLALKVAPEILGSTTTNRGRVDVLFRIAASDVSTAAIRRLRTNDLKWSTEDAYLHMYTPEARAMFA